MNLNLNLNRRSQNFRCGGTLDQKCNVIFRFGVGVLKRIGSGKGEG